MIDNPSPFWWRRPGATTDDGHPICPDTGRKLPKPIAAAPMATDAPGVPSPGAAEAGYGVTAALKTIEMCMLAKVPPSIARAFIAARTPIPLVRASLFEQAAAAADALVTISNPAKPMANSEWSEITAQVNRAMGSESKA